MRPSKTAGNRKEAAAKGTDERSGREKDADPTTADAHQQPKKTCRQARAPDFLSVFDQNTIAGVNATNNLTKRANSRTSQPSSTVCFSSRT